MKKIAFVILPFLIVHSLSAQNHTVGLLKADHAKTFRGYNLLFPLDQSNLYLLDNCGRVVHTWADASDTRPGNWAYLMNDGSVIKTKRSANVTGNPIWSGGGGGTVERRDWDNKLLWTYTLNDSFNRLHHDIEPMPNGNILMISWEKKTAAQAIAQGRNPSFVANGEIWPDKVIEVKPIGADSFSIVWEWHLWDHLIQNFDSTKPNYGDPAKNPGKMNLNYGGAGSAKTWAFSNAIAYNSELDQIALSSPSINEIWIIDHSTTSLEAKGSSGGKSKSGGDFIYRWGNPATYNSGTASDQKLFFQHDIHWMTENPADSNYGRLMVFNNRANAKYSTVNYFKPNFNKTSWQYAKDMSGKTFLPAGFDWTYRRPDSSALMSQIISSVQRLPNGNTLICSGQQGYSFEITPAQEVVWEYVTPFKAGVAVKQGDTVKLGENNSFRIYRYAHDHPALIGRDLSPKGYLELEPDTGFCHLPSIGFAKTETLGSTLVFPNPGNDLIRVVNRSSAQRIQQIQVFTLTGELVLDQTHLNSDSTDIDVSQLPSGLYFLNLNQGKQVLKLEIRH